MVSYVALKVLVKLFRFRAVVGSTWLRFFLFFGSVDRVSVALCLFRGLYIGWHCFYLFIVFLLSSFFQRLSIARGKEGMG